MWKQIFGLKIKNVNKLVEEKLDICDDCMKEVRLKTFSNIEKYEYYDSNKVNYHIRETDSIKELIKLEKSKGILEQLVRLDRTSEEFSSLISEAREILK